MKSSYNERFSFADPLAKVSACCVTRYRAKKLKEDPNATAGCNPQYQHSEETLMVSCRVVSGEVEDEVVPIPFATENSPSSDDISTSLDPYTSIDYDVCYNVCEELDLLNNPQSLEISDLVIHDSTDNHIEEDDEGGDNEVTNNECSLRVQHELLYKEASITTSASSVLLMKYAMKHKLSMEALTDVLHIIKLHCPSPNDIPSTFFHFKKQFKDFQYPVKYHYFCNACLSEVPKTVEFCSNQACSYSFTKANSLSVLIELPVGLQLKSILGRKCTTVGSMVSQVTARCI